MPIAAPEQTKRGPFTVLLLLFGLVLGSTSAAAARADLSQSPARLAQHRPGKAGLLLRTNPRELVATDEDRFDKPLLGTATPRPVAATTIVLPGSLGAFDSQLAPHPAAPSAYNARAPPAA